MSCLFCSFASRALPADILFENDGAFALLDIHPAAPGHTLLIPKVHAETILDLPPASLLPLFSLLQKTTQALSKTLEAPGFTIGINHGKAAGQGIGHLHIHIIPRFEGDGGGSLHSVVRRVSEEPLETLRERIQRDN